MAFEDVSEEVRRVVNAMRRSRDRDSPFAIVTGAGCSHSAGIPLAGDLVHEAATLYRDECERLIGRYRLDDYGAVMGCLTLNERKQLLGRYLAGSKVNAAHLAIAALMKEGYVDQVLTFNFDRVLAQACVLLGFNPFVYDLGMAPSADTDSIMPGSILHLHGQGFGCVCSRSEEEARAHADSLRHVIHNMLWSGPAMFVGYSGQRDAVFPVMKREFKGHDRLFWIDAREAPNEKQAELIAMAPRTSAFIGGADADRYMVAIASGLGCWPPRVFSDPFGYLLEAIDAIGDLPSESRVATESVRSKLRTRLNEELMRVTSSEAVLDMTKLIVPVREKEPEPEPPPPAIAETPAAVEIPPWFGMTEASQAEAPPASDDEAVENEAGLDRFVEAAQLEPLNPRVHYEWGAALLDRAAQDQDETVYREAIAKFERALELKAQDADALADLGNAYFGLAEKKRDETLYRAAVAKYQDALAANPGQADTTFNLGMALNALAALKRDETLYREAAARLEETVALSPEDADALCGWGQALEGLASLKNDEEMHVTAHQRFVEALGIAPDNHFAGIGAGTALLSLARMKGDESLYRDACVMFESAHTEDGASRESIWRWGEALGGLAALRKDPALFGEAVAKFTAAMGMAPASREELGTWAATLSQLGDLKRDPAIYRDALAKINAALEMEPKEMGLVGARAAVLSRIARLTRDTVLFRDASSAYAEVSAAMPRDAQVLAHWGRALVGQAEAADDPAFYRQAVEKFETALKIDPKSAEAMTGWGNALAGLAAKMPGDALFHEAYGKFAAALKLKPGMEAALHDWAAAMLAWWRHKHDPQILVEAREILDWHQAVNPNRPYLRACLAALEENESECEAKLKRCRELGQLPAKDLLDAAPEFEKLRAKKWFRDLVERAA
jgi:tetratricopeptide (TPR) repeat protein/NAD-dependent SIR2 family protein deacetylase